MAFGKLQEDKHLCEDAIFVPLKSLSQRRHVSGWSLDEAGVVASLCHHHCILAKQHGMMKVKMSEQGFLMKHVPVATGFELPDGLRGIGSEMFSTYLIYLHMDISENSGTPKSSVLIGFSIINHPFWGTLFLETPIYLNG